nr:MAG TPA: hypothetical protein [Caudoviricetes sp.]
MVELLIRIYYKYILWINNITYCTVKLKVVKVK